MSLKLHLFAVTRRLLLPVVTMLLMCVSALSFPLFSQSQYELVTDASMLADGDEIVFVARSANKAMGGQNGDYRDAVPVTVSPDGQTLEYKTGIQRMIYRVVDGGAALITIDENSGDITGYLNYSGNKNHVYTTTATAEPASWSDNCKWTITKVGSLFAVSNVGNTQRTLQYNAGSPRFACYTSNQTKLSIYRKVVEYYQFEVAVNDENAALAEKSADDEIEVVLENGYTYATPAYTVSPEGMASVEQNGDVFTVTNLRGNCTITINTRKARTTVALSDSEAGTVTADPSQEGLFWIELDNSKYIFVMDNLFSVTPSKFQAHFDGQAANVDFDGGMAFIEMPALYNEDIDVEVDVKYVRLHSLTFVDKGSQMEVGCVPGSFLLEVAGANPSSGCEDAYSFYGWTRTALEANTFDRPSDVVEAGETMPKENLILYSVYSTSGDFGTCFSSSPCEQTTVTFDANGGAGAMLPANVMGAMTLPECAFTKDGYLFAGWEYDGDILSPQNNILVPQGAITLTAQWKPEFGLRQYRKVMSVDELREGDFVIIVSEEKNDAMGVQSANNRRTAAVRLSTGGDLASSDDAAVFRIGYDDGSGLYSLYEQEVGYLYSASTSTSGENYLRSSVDKEYRWKITISSEGVATIEDKVVNNRYSRFIKRNNSSSLYSCYTGGQSGVALYVAHNAEVREGDAAQRTVVVEAWNDREASARMVNKATNERYNVERTADGEFLFVYDPAMACLWHTAEILDGDGMVVRTADMVLPMIVSGGDFTWSAPDGETPCRDCRVVAESGRLALGYNFDADPHQRLGDVEVSSGATLRTETPQSARRMVVRAEVNEAEAGLLVADIENDAEINLTVGAEYRLTIDCRDFYFFSLPYDCYISDVRFADGTPVVFYDGANDASANIEIRSYSEKGRADKYKYTPDNEAEVWQFLQPGDMVEAGRGYLMGVWTEDKKEVVFPMPAESLGAYNAERTAELTITGKDDEAYRANDIGWHLIGNHTMAEYPLAISVGDIALPIYYFDQTERVYVPVEAERSYSIAPNSAVFVQIPSAGDVLIRRAEAASQAPRLQSAPSEAKLRLSLTDDGSGKADCAIIRISDSFTTDYEIGCDLAKMLALKRVPQFYISAAGGNLAFGAIPTGALDGTRLGYYAPQAGSYTISMMAAGAALESDVMLEDRLTGVVTNLSLYDYTFDVATDKEQSDSRFVITYAPQVVTGVGSEGDAHIAVFSSGDGLVVEGIAPGAELRLYDVAGRLLLAQESAADRMTLDRVPAGVYMMEVFSKGNSVWLKVRK